ncbi:putative flagellar protein [gamma proteobacterium NOR5-3]|nr:putative flagellar protein [gamma proteobacterium NOR5-3]
MADPVNSPLLSVSPVESSSLKGGKAGNTGAKSGESDGFSRVLDAQRGRDAKSSPSASESSSVGEPGGKTLPPEGNDPADVANTDAKVVSDNVALAEAPADLADSDAKVFSDNVALAEAPADVADSDTKVFSDNVALATDDGSAEADVNTSTTAMTGVTDGLSSSTRGVAELAASPDDSVAPESRALPAGDGSAISLPEPAVVGTNTKAGGSMDALPLAGTSDPRAPLAGNSTSTSPSGADSPAGSLQATATLLSTPGSAAPPSSTVASNAPFAFEAPSAPLQAPAGGAAQPATASLSAKPVAGAALNSATVTPSTLLGDDVLGAPAASTPALNESGDLAKSFGTGDTLSKGLAQNTAQRGAASQMDPTAMNRSTADWLRSGMGSEAAGQRALADAQLEGAGELTRGVASLQRADGSAPALATSTVAGLTPPSSGASSALPAATATPGAVPQYSLSRAPDDVEFPGELSARMKTLVRDGVREARLQLHPAELGRLQVTVTTEGDQTKVVFTAETAAARDAIEQSMPRLRDMLEQSGLQLAQSDVGQGDLQGNSERGGDGQLAGQQGSAEAVDNDAPVLVTSQLGNSRIDTYI